MQFPERVRELSDSGKKVVFTNGCFDILHAGHIDLLQRARDLGDVLVVAINSDASVHELKGSNRPIVPEQERAELLAGLDMVDFVCAFDEDTPLEAIVKMRPDVLVKGADWGINDIVGRAEVEGWGGKVVALPLIEGKSTTGIVERVLDALWKSWKKEFIKSSARISDVADFRRIAADILRGDAEAAVSGLSGSARALFIAGLWQSLRRPLIVVTPHDRGVAALTTDIAISTPN